MKTTLLTVTSEGLYCPVGGFHIDPWRPVPRAIITHAHADHARWGCEHYLIAEPGKLVFQARLGLQVSHDTMPYGEFLQHNGVTISFHPAGHLLGSAQIRLEHQGEIVVVSGDYKLAEDRTCERFEPVRCHTFVTESTFGLPIYRWATAEAIFSQINSWWRANREAGKTSVLYAYALGKAQRILAGIDPSIGPIVVHGAIEKINEAYRNSGVRLPATNLVREDLKKGAWAGSLVLAPPSTQSSSWVKRFEPASEAVASGWMAVRGVRRRRAIDRGFVLSDHADWLGLNEAVRETRAERVLVTHGSTEVFARWLRDSGLDAEVLATQYQGEADEPATEGA